MGLRFARALAVAIAPLLAVAATGCGQSADEQARDALESAVQDVGPHSSSISEYCREHIATSVKACRDEFANAAAYCPWPDDEMPTVLRSWEAADGQALRIRGRYRNGASYTVEVVVVIYHDQPRLDHPYWLDGHSQPPCPDA